MLEKSKLEFPQLQFKSLISNVEYKINHTTMKSLNMSPSQAVTADPILLQMFSQTDKLKERKHLRQSYYKPETVLSIGSIVKVKKFTKKDEFGKESYGAVSDEMYVVKDRTTHSNLFQYMLGDVFTLNSLPMTYRANELICVPLSYLKLCLELEKKVDTVVKQFVDENV